MADQLLIGVDIGGTNLRCGLVDRTGRILERRRCLSRIEEGRDGFCQRLLDEVAQLRIRARQLGRDVGGIGIGIPGLIGNDGRIHSSVNMRSLEGFNLEVCLKSQCGLPVSSGNDANVIALGEQRFGAGRGYSSCVVVTVGTGLGSGLILNDKIWTGRDGFAAEFGHITVEPEGLPCPCGNLGCLEQYVSAGALLRYFSQESPEQRLDRLDAAQIAKMAERGDAAASAAFDRLGYWLGTALASLINTLNIEAVIIGGGVSESIDLFSAALREQLRRRAFQQVSDGVVIEKALLGDDAGLLGGAALVADSC